MEENNITPTEDSKEEPQMDIPQNNEEVETTQENSQENLESATSQTPAQEPKKESQLPPTKKADPKDVEQNKIFGIISYIWILCFIPLFLKPDSEYVKFHAKQGLLLFFSWVAIYIVSQILYVVSFRLGYVVLSIGNLFILIFSILGIMHAMNGNLEKLPFIGQYADKINI